MEMIGNTPHKPATKSLVWVVLRDQSQTLILYSLNLNFRNFILRIWVSVHAAGLQVFQVYTDDRL
jgi:hypothetical protein